MVTKCICNICTCGRHHCPLHNKGSNAIAGGVDSSGGSEYKQKYPGHTGAKGQNYKPRQEALRSDAPFDGTTTSKADYVAKDMPIRQTKERARYEPPTGSMDMRSSYKDDFVENGKLQAPQQEKRKPIKPRDHDILKSDSKFEGTSSAKADYKGFDPQARQQPIRPNDSQVASTGPFQGVSGYKADYQQHEGGRPRTNFKPKQDAIKNDTPFQGQTVSKQDYQEKPLPEKQQRRKQEYVPSDAPFESMTTNKMSYIPQERAVAVQESFRPPNQPVTTDQPFGGNSTTRDDYKEWQVKAPEKKDRARWEKPEGSMDMNTTNKMDFAERGRGSPAKPVRPNPSNIMDGGKFDDTTTAKTDFRQWESNPRSKITKENGYRPPSGKFEDTTTSKTSYAPMPTTEKTRSYKPQQQALATNVPFEGSTTSHEAYQVKAGSPCPAIGLIKPGNAKYKFVDEDPRGHQFFDRNNRSNSVANGKVMQTVHS